MLQLNDITISNNKPLTLIAGLNAFESTELVNVVAAQIQQIAAQQNIGFIFKVSIDKANRSSIDSFRGIGIDKALQCLYDLKQKLNIALITDVHEPAQAERFAEVCDILQLPAFLARQTDLVEALAQTDRIINIKKPQFLSPSQMVNIVHKFYAFNNRKLMLCERGSNFGYDNLVVDMLGLQVMREENNDIPIIFDVTHALQKREQGSASSGGRADQLFGLARAGVATKIAGLFVEVHPNPDQALCDGASALTLDQLSVLIEQVQQIDSIVKKIQ